MTLRRTVRSHQWWHHKLAPLVGVAGVSVILAGRTAEASAVIDVALVLVAAVGIAAFGHVVNDWADIDADARAGKPSAVAALAPPVRAVIIIASLGAGIGAWAVLAPGPVAWVALAVEVGLLLAYSVPPIRLKGRGWAGALADAAYAYAVPFVLAVTGIWADVPLLALVPVGVTGLLVGLRGILWHQVDDVEADRSAGVETVAARWGPPRVAALVADALLPVEVLSIVVLVVLLRMPWTYALVAVFVAYRCLQMFFLWERPLDVRELRHGHERVRILGFEGVNELLEKWLPPAALVVLALHGSAWWWLALVLHGLLFRTIVRDVVLADVWGLPDAIERLAFSRGMRADIRAVARDREAAVAAGPDPEGAAAGRWVFVVCGPDSHLLTLRTAVHHLRPVTAAEIWVLTDGRRNEHVIDIDGVDRVVDVATPDRLDDHQASIWLKTSVHRHVPPGEWCYLDSDIIATRPGVEGIFAHRQGPVAFASDVTIRENSVDRFSPWAMTCSCLGYDDQHSCGHLREQLRARFDLDVPGDWLHWNGGVFLFGPDSGEFLDVWHERAVASFEWPEWRTRDQGALISTVWTFGLQDLPRLPAGFNFIADLGNHDLCLDHGRGWAHHPSGPWHDVHLMHLYTSPLEDPSWDLSRDVEAVVMRRSRVRVARWKRGELRARTLATAHDVRSRASMTASDLRWTVQPKVELYVNRMRRVPSRLKPWRVRRAIRARLGLPVEAVELPSGGPGVRPRPLDESDGR